MTPKSFKWRKSAYSGENGGCVEVASLPDAVAVRDSKNPDGGAFTLRRALWHEVHDAIRSGSLDL